MCRKLGVPRSLVYYKKKARKIDGVLENAVIEIFRKSRNNYDTQLDEKLVQKLEQLFSALNCSKIIVNSSYRCASHDRNVGGNGSGQHTKGTATDIVCYDKNGKKISSKIVCCAAQDIDFAGIANIDGTYTATHVDVRTGVKWFGDEMVTTAYSVTDDFYNHWKLSKADVYGTVKKSITVSVVIDGKSYSGELREVQASIRQFSTKIPAISC